MKTLLLDLTPLQLEELIIKGGFPKFRANQVQEWVYKKRVENFADCANLPADLKIFLEDNFCLRSFKIAEKQVSELDSTARFVFSTTDGMNVTAVSLPMKNRNSICISTQIGCPMKCSFCASGQMGFKRNLSAGEILEQIIQVEKNINTKIDSILFMGMGEPLANYQNVVNTLASLINQKRFGYGRRNIVVSTAGMVPQIEKLSEENLGIRLALSLHAPDDETRKQIISETLPYSVEDIFVTGLRYSRITKSRLTLEYILFSGVNDSLEHAKKLAGLVKKEKFYTDEIKINLIKYNPIDSDKWKAPQDETIQEFKDYLMKEGLLAIIRESKGQDIGAACGQLFV